MGNFFNNFWDALTHPVSMIGGAIKLANNQDDIAAQGLQDHTWSSSDIINYFRDNAYPDGSVASASKVAGSSTPGSSTDVSGYDQAAWDLEKTRELLEEQRAYNSAEAEKNRQWQERMSNTAYQRATEDLEAAGLNKWLAVTGGNGASASTPSGATASSSAGDVSTPTPQIFKQLISSLASIFGSAAKIAGKK